MTHQNKVEPVSPNALPPCCVTPFVSSFVAVVAVPPLYPWDFLPPLSPCVALVPHPPLGDDWRRPTQGAGAGVGAVINVNVSRSE